MLRALLLLVALASLVGWSGRLAQGAWRDRGTPAFAIWRLLVAYLVASLSLLLAATMLEWEFLIAAARAFAWPFVLLGETVHDALRSSLPQALVPLSAIGLSLAAAILLYLADRRIRRLSGIAP